MLAHTNVKNITREKRRRHARGVLREGQPPNVKRLPNGLSRAYGRLSELAHVSKRELLYDFVETDECAEIATTLPTYNPGWSKMLIAHLIAFMEVLGCEIYAVQLEIYPDISNLKLLQALQHTGETLESIGFWKTVPNCKR